MNNSLIYYDNSLNENNKEIQLLKTNLQEKDNEIQLSNQKINNSLNENNKEIQMIKITLLKSLDNFENVLTENNKEIELLKQNSSLLDEMNEKLNRNFLDIQRVKQLESNIALLLNFKVKIKADFYIDNRQVHLCSHKIKNNYPICVNEGVSYIFSLEEGEYYKSYKIKNKETGKYLYINSNQKRDLISYFIDLTSSKSEATDFYFTLYHE